MLSGYDSTDMVVSTMSWHQSVNDVLTCSHGHDHDHDHGHGYDVLGGAVPTTRGSVLTGPAIDVLHKGNPSRVPWPSGKARVCKTLIPRFKSGRHLKRSFP